MRKNNHLTLNIEGVNLKRLLKNLYKNNIDVYDVNFVSYKNVQLTIKNKDYKKIKKYLTDYRFNILNRYGLCYLKNYAIIHIGFVIGLFIFFMLNFFNNNFLSTIYITGNNRIANSDIISFLAENNIKTNTFFNNINTDALEINLENNFEDISLVSVIKKGTNLIINIKEKLFIEDIMTNSDIVSEYDGQIIELSIIQGTSKFKEGDIVKKGDIIVNGYLMSNDKKIQCKAIANIKMKVWYSASFTFLNEEIKSERTGKIIKNTYYNLFNKTIPIKVKENTFSCYEKEIKNEYLFKNFIFPIKIYTEKFYEIKENLIKNDFSLQKDAIIEQTIKEATEKVPKNIVITNITTEISDTLNGKVVTSYAETIYCFS